MWAVLALPFVVLTFQRRFMHFSPAPKIPNPDHRVDYIHGDIHHPRTDMDYTQGRAVGHAELENQASAPPAYTDV